MKILITALIMSVMACAAEETQLQQEIANVAPPPPIIEKTETPKPVVKKAKKLPPKKHKAKKIVIDTNGK